MKYMGSKARIAKELSIIMNKIIVDNKIKNYIEPFVGGANMIEHIKCENRYGLDSNRYLINMWKALQNGYKPPETISKEEYHSVRKNKDSYPDEFVAFVGFVSTYKAKWFGGYADIGIEKGKPRNYYDESKRNILKQLPKVQNVVFMNKSFQEMDIAKTKNCLVYCDPPYQGTTEYKDAGIDYEFFWNWVRKLSERNIVLISEYNAPEDFECIWSKKLVTSLDHKKRKNDLEKFFVHKSLKDKIGVL